MKTREVARVLAGCRDDWRLRVPNSPRVARPGLSWSGPVVLIGAIGAGWFAFADATGEEGSVAFGLFIGSASILLMAFSFVLSTRLRWLEPFFGGLDRMYRWHRWFGAIAIGAMWLHIQFTDDVEGIRGAAESTADAAEDLAGTAETLLYVLVAVSLIRWVPYRWWRQSHKLLIVPYVFACWHFHTATKPYANDSLWGRWFQALMIIGIVAWVWRVVWRDGVRRGRRYTVSSVSSAGTVATVVMEPVGTPLKYAAGQFAFFKFGSSSVSEPHPFTISSAPHDPFLRIHVKELGDWSNNLSHRIEVGSPVVVEGPYGRLLLTPRSEHTTLWIAGGVGITPFLGKVRSLREGDAVPHLFYAVRSEADAPALDELRSAAQAGRIDLHVHVSAAGCRLTADDLRRFFGDSGLKGAHVVMCGPETLVRDMTAAVRKLGARQVHVEGFDIRTGIGPDLSLEVDELVHRIKAGVAARRYEPGEESSDR